ncbi:MAG: holo-ACP synthase [Calditrichaeota bacterium]|nr:holo-ACP synthase [Calditrichota bacterium]MCB9391377.1 holo-ACP synthase [Calditrichota bacterium]
MPEKIPPEPILPSLGIDLVEVERIASHLEDTAFLERIFTEAERTECLKRAKPEECLAARWATKEAVAKALGTGIGEYLAFKDVEVLTVPGKGPRVRIHGPYSAYPMRVSVSLTHTKTTAAAVVMIFPEDSEQEIE